jgi:hypothetical protein
MGGFTGETISTFQKQLKSLLKKPWKASVSISEPLILGTLHLADEEQFTRLIQPREPRSPLFRDTLMHFYPLYEYAVNMDMPATEEFVVGLAQQFFTNGEAMEDQPERLQDSWLNLRDQINIAREQDEEENLGTIRGGIEEDQQQRIDLEGDAPARDF